MGALKQVLQYLSGTRSYRITYSNSSSHITNYLNDFYGFADAAFTNQDDFKSTSGYVFLAAGGAITWRSKKQTMILLSSTEACAEYVTLAESTCKLCWLCNLYEELGYA